MLLRVGQSQEVQNNVKDKKLGQATELQTKLGTESRPETEATTKVGAEEQVCGRFQNRSEDSSS